MTVLRKLARSLESSAPLTSNALADWLTGATSGAAGVAVTEKRVLGLPAYYRAMALTSGTLARMPIKVYKNGTRERVTTRTVLDAPNPRQTKLEFWMTMYLGAIGWGTGYARKLRDGSGIVRQIWPIHPSRVRVEEVIPTPDNPAGLIFWVRGLDGFEKPYTTDDIFHLPYMSPDGVVGVRPLQIFRQSLGIAIAGDDSAASFYANGSRLSGILTTKDSLTNDQAESLKARWKRMTAGPRNSGEIAVLDNDATFAPVAIPPADAQLLESRQWAISEIARMVGTPPHLIGDVEKSTSWGTGIEEQVLGWVKFTLDTWLGLSEQRITRELLPGGDQGPWYAEHSLEGLLRGDSKSRALFYHYGITDGWMNRNEVRSLENLEPEDGLDEFIVPSNMAVIAVDGSMQPLATAA